MERHLSTGVDTIVALLAAHRLTAEQEQPVSLAQAVAQVSAHLRLERTRTRHASDGPPPRVWQQVSGSRRRNSA